MKILHVIESLTRGGAERLVAELTREFAAAGAQSSVACLSTPGPWAARLEAEGLYAGCLGKRKGIDISCIAGLRRLVRETAPDIVNTHLFTANLWTRLAGLQRRKWGLVVTLHNVDNWRGPLHRAADRLLAAAADRYVAVGPAVASYYRNCGLPRKRLRLIPNAIRWDAVSESIPFTRPVPLVRAVGRLVPQKGFDVLVRAAAILAEKGCRVRVEIIGDGPERASLAALVSQNGLAESVFLLGPRDDARRLIAGADIFVMPSLREGLPLVLLEALHAGRPVVATRLPALDGVVENAREAVLVPPGSPLALAAAIERLPADPPASRAMARAGRERAQKDFSIQRAASSYLDLYSEVVAERTT